MLQSLSIKNFALIKSESIEFGDGLNIFLGETGAGKSLVFDAIFFALGLKSDKSLIRNGEPFAKVDVLFSGLSEAVKNEISNEGFEIDDELLLSRTLNEDGRNSIKINGDIATIASLKNISKLLVDTLVQHESLDLLKTKNHLIMLDSFVGEKALKLKNEIGKLLSEISTIDKKIDSLGGDEEERERRKDIFSFQIDEIERANITIGEDVEIDEKLSFLNSAEKIKETLAVVLKSLSGDNGAVNNIANSSRLLNSISSFEKISSLQERLDSSRYELEDVYAELESIFESSNFDEIEYNRLDQRRDLLKMLKKKYGPTLEDILSFYDKTKLQYDEISSSEIFIEKLTKEKNILLEKLNATAEELSALRKQNADVVKEKIVNELKDLGMKGTKFEIVFNKKNSVNSDGFDDVTFEFSANVGQAVKNISKTASGGEISRIMLAIKNVFSSAEINKTLLFDEVDSGISGETGNMVAQKLQNIAQNEQIICITHLPQVASAGDYFIKVQKTTLNNETITNATILDEKDIPNEIARLISGEKITETAIKNATELRNKFIRRA